MTLCPIAVVAGCRKCPAYSICPLKGALGDYKPDADRQDAKPKSSGRPEAAKRGTSKR
jgi:hypothetical protein